MLSDVSRSAFYDGLFFFVAIFFILYKSVVEFGSILFLILYIVHMCFKTYLQKCLFEFTLFISLFSKIHR